MKKIFIYNFEGDDIFSPSLDFLKNQPNVEMHSSLTEMYLAINELEGKDFIDIYFLTHGFRELDNQDRIKACLLETCKTPVNPIIKMLELLGKNKIENLIFIACNTEHEIEGRKTIKRIFSYSKYIRYDDLLPLTKFLFGLLNNNCGNIYEVYEKFRFSDSSIGFIDKSAFRLEPDGR